MITVLTEYSVCSDISIAYAAWILYRHDVKSRVYGKKITLKVHFSSGKTHSSDQPSEKKVIRRFDVVSFLLAVVHLFDSKEFAIEEVSSFNVSCLPEFIQHPSFRFGEVVGDKYLWSRHVTQVLFYTPMLSSCHFSQTSRSLSLAYRCNDFQGDDELYAHRLW